MTALGKQVFVDNYSRYVKSQLSDSSNKEDTDQESLSLAFENLIYMPFDIMDKYNETLHTLDISHNNFRNNLNFLSEFENLTSLNLDHNNIDSRTILPFMPKLRLLWLNYNNIECLQPFFKNLRKRVPNLQYLSLIGNPTAPNNFNDKTCNEYLQYRLKVISWFPHLVHLDNCTVTQEQRLLAKKRWLSFRQYTTNAPFSKFVKLMQDKLSNIFANPIHPTPESFTASKKVNLII